MRDTNLLTGSSTARCAVSICMLTYRAYIMLLAVLDIRPRSQMHQPCRYYPRQRSQWQHKLAPRNCQRGVTCASDSQHKTRNLTSINVTNHTSINGRHSHVQFGKKKSSVFGTVSGEYINGKITPNTASSAPHDA